MTCTLPCCGCACSATRLFGCHPSRCSPPLFHSHVRENSTLGVRTLCLASRVACVRARSWLSHPRPPDRSQHGCTVGVLPGPTRVLPMPRQYGIGRRAPTRAVLVGVLWCAYTVCGLCRQYVLYCVLSHKWHANPRQLAAAHIHEWWLPSVCLPHSWCRERCAKHSLPVLAR